MNPFINLLPIQSFNHSWLFQPNSLTLLPAISQHRDLALLLSNTSNFISQNRPLPKQAEELGIDPIKKVKTIEKTMTNAGVNLGSISSLPPSLLPNNMITNTPHYLNSLLTLPEHINMNNILAPNKVDQSVVQNRKLFDSQSLQNISHTFPSASLHEPSQQTKESEQPGLDAKSDTASTNTQSPLLSSKTPQIRFLESKKLNEEKDSKIKVFNASTTAKKDAPSQKKTKKIEVMSEDELESEESEDEDDDDGGDTFKPTKHCFYVAKKTIKEKRVLPVRRKPEVKKIDERSINPLEYISQLMPRVTELLQMEDIDQPKLYLALQKCNFDIEKTLYMIKSNRRYYKRHLKMKQ